MESTAPDLFTYTDYRQLLKDIYAHRKEADHRFSHRYIAIKVGATSSGWFSDIVNNRINLTRTYMVNLCKLLAFTSRESDFFELLVNYNQAATLDEKNVCFHKILTFRDVSGSLVNKEQFEYFSKWYLTAIRELLLFHDFKRSDYQEIGRLLDPSIRAADAKKALELLFKLGLIEEKSGGILKPVEETVVKDSAFKSVYWANFMVSMMKLAMESVDRHEASQRDISAVTVGLSSESLKTARMEIAALRQKLLALSEQDKKTDIVYQCNIQLFPLSRRREAKC